MIDYVNLYCTIPVIVFVFPYLNCTSTFSQFQLSAFGFFQSLIIFFSFE